MAAAIAGALRPGDQQVDAAGLLVHLDRAQFLGRHLYAERLLHERRAAHDYGRAASRDYQIRVTGDGCQASPRARPETTATVGAQPDIIARPSIQRN